MNKACQSSWVVFWFEPVLSQQLNLEAHDHDDDDDDEVVKP